MLIFTEYQILMYLVAYDIDTVFIAYLEQPFQLFLFPNASHRIMGRAEHKQLYVFIDYFFLKILIVGSVISVFIYQSAAHKPSARILNGVHEGIVAGRKDYARRRSFQSARDKAINTGHHTRV